MKPTSTSVLSVLPSAALAGGALQLCLGGLPETFFSSGMGSSGTGTTSKSPAVQDSLALTSL